MFEIVQSDPLNVLLVYRSPNSSVENNLELASLVKNTKKNTIIIGDFNYPNINWSSDVAGTQVPLVEAVNDRFLTQMVDFPTHVKGNILDLIFTDIPENVISVDNIGNLGNSDHAILSIELDLSPSFNQSNELIRDWRKGDEEGLKGYLSSINFEEEFREKDANECWMTLLDICNSAQDRYIPLTPRRAPGAPPWLTSGVKRLVNRKQRLWKRFTKNRNNANFESYKSAEKLCKKGVQSAKRNFEKKLAKSGNKRPFNAYIKSKSKVKGNIGPLKVGGNLVTSNVGMAQELNQFFTSVFSLEPIGPLPECKKSVQNLSLLDITITSAQVKKKIQQLKPGSAPGPDKITTRLLTTNIDSLSPALSTIFNRSLQTGVVPADWKTVHVTPIFKKGSKSKSGNYRPVSLTSIPCKLMESCLRDAVYEFLVVHDLIKPSQHGFMSKKSCTTNLLEFLEMATKELDQGRNVDIVYLDFAKAFDKVPHRRLLAKIEAHGIGGKILTWIGNWLQGRTQRTVLNGASSDWSSVESGVPQGSVLGPLCFIIFIDDLDDATEPATITNKFADDTKLAQTINSDADKTSLQGCLNNLCEWADTWGMAYNVDKCKVMHVGRSNPGHTYEMSGTNLTATTSERDIGVIVQQNLRPSKQCEEAARRANAVLGQISRSFHFRDRQTFIKLFKVYVRPHLEFAAPAWSPWSARDQEILEKVQKRALGMVSGLKGTYQQRLKELNMLSLEDRRRLGDLVQVFKIVHGIDKVDLNTWFTLVGNNPVRATRATSDALNLVRPVARGEVRRGFFSVRVVDTWNTLPSDTKRAQSVPAFRNQVENLIKENFI